MGPGSTHRISKYLCICIWCQWRNDLLSGSGSNCSNPSLQPAGSGSVLEQLERARRTVVLRVGSRVTRTVGQPLVE